MAGKDTEEEAESAGEDRVATAPPRADETPARPAADPPEGTADILSITPTDIAAEAPAAAPDDRPVDLPSPDPETSRGETPIEPTWDGGAALQRQTDTGSRGAERAADRDSPRSEPTDHMAEQIRVEPLGDSLEFEHSSHLEAQPPFHEPPQAPTPEPAAEAVEPPPAQSDTGAPGGLHHVAYEPSAPPTTGTAERIPPAHAEAAPRSALDHESAAENASAREAQFLKHETALPEGKTGASAPVVADFVSRKADALRLIKSGARYATIGAAGYLAFVVLQIFAYRIIDPPGSTLMLIRLLGGTGVERTWVPIGRISPNLIRAVIVSEDGRFCDHWGIDLEAIEEAIRRSGSGTPRGASTISMQVTKNLFLWPSKSYLRKIVELPLTLLIELVWPKRRILEIYLNIAEWGPGIFGAEAAARHHFRRSAAGLGEREAALLAASLPNPVRRDAGDPGPATSRKARVIQARMHISGPVAACVTGNR